MSKKILASLGVVVGLGLALFLGYQFFYKPGLEKPAAPGSPGPFQGVIRPTPEPTPKPDFPASPPAALPEPAPPAAVPAAPSAGTPAPSPAPPPAAPEIAPSTPPAPKEETGLLAGKSRSYRNAKRLLAKIQKQNIPAFIRKKGKYYQVWAGPFPTSQEAEQAKQVLRTALKVSPKREKLEMPVPK